MSRTTYMDTLRRLFWVPRDQATPPERRIHEKTHRLKAAAVAVGLMALTATFVPALVAAGAFCVLFLPFFLPFLFLGMKGQPMPPHEDEEQPNEARWLQ